MHTTVKITDTWICNSLWLRMARKPAWLLALIVLLAPLIDYWPLFDLYGHPGYERQCEPFTRVIVFADSQGFTDKRHIRVCNQ